MEPALRARLGSFSPAPARVLLRGRLPRPEVMRTHGYHWFDKALRSAHEPPRRARSASGALLYNIFNTRTEGHATGWRS